MARIVSASTGTPGWSSIAHTPIDTAAAASSSSTSGLVNCAASLRHHGMGGAWGSALGP